MLQKIRLALGNYVTTTGATIAAAAGALYAAGVKFEVTLGHHVLDVVKVIGVAGVAIIGGGAKDGHK